MNINMTLFGQMVAFAVFVWFCMKYVWPALDHAMEERKTKIADGLEAADRAMRDLELAQGKATEQLKEAKQEVAALLEQANKRANQIVEEAKAKAQAESERIKASAMAEVEQELNRAREELRAKVGVLAIAAAEKILESSIDENANRELVDKLAAQL